MWLVWRELEGRVGDEVRGFLGVRFYIDGGVLIGLIVR